MTIDNKTASAFLSSSSEPSRWDEEITCDLEVDGKYVWAVMKLRDLEARERIALHVLKLPEHRQTEIFKEAQQRLHKKLWKIEKNH